MGDIFGKLLGVVLAFILCILAPLTIVVMSDDMADRRAIYSEVTGFVDQVIDTGYLDDTNVSDFLYGVSSYGPICEVKIVRHMRVVNPTAGGGIEVTYVPMDTWVEGMDVKFNKGDLIQVSVEAVEYTGAQKVARLTIGMALKPIKYSVSGRIRV